MGGRKTIGVIHSEVFEFLKKNYKQIWVISLVLYGVEMLLGIVMSIFVVPLNLVVGFAPALFLRAGAPDSLAGALAALGPVFGILAVVMLVVFVLGILITIAQYASYIGGYDATLRLLGGEQATFEGVTGNFRRNWKRFVGVVAWQMLWEILWGLLLVVPGIVKHYSYMLAPFLVLRYPELTVRQALRKSIEMTDGYRGRLFGLDMILLLYALLSVVGLVVVFVGALAVEVLLLTPMMLLLYSIAFQDIREAALEKGLLPPDAVR